MTRCQYSEIIDGQSCDIAIIGAGISGLYCAWRLLEHDPSLQIRIIERLNRTGGRLDTDIIEFGGGVRVREEEGGMRFNYEMDELMTLIKAMGLCDKIVDFPMGSADDTNRFFLRGHNFTLAEAEASGNMIWSDLYDLKPQEQGLSPSQIVTVAFDTILFENGKVPKHGRKPDEWTKLREKAKWKGKTLNQWQLWGLLRDMGYSEECIQMLTETIGFAGPFKSIANAGDALQILADFPIEPEYYTFKEGFSTLPNAVEKRLEDDHGDNVQIMLSTNVDALDQQDSYVLSLTEAPCQRNSSPVVPGGVSKSLHASKVIVAAATKGMEDLFRQSPALRSAPDAQKLWDNIHSVLGMKLMKINLYFDRPWWENGMTQRPSVQFGPSFTGLPINAIYPFYALQEKVRIQTSGAAQGEPDIPSDAAAALTMYCDFNNTNFWHGLQNIGPMFSSPMQDEQNAKVPQTLFGASQAVVDEARKQIGTLFGVNYVPVPVLTSYRLWDGQEDFEYAYHQWRLNVEDSAVREYLAAPRDDLHFCNEAISDVHGWVNGSLRSSDLVLKAMGLGPMEHDPCQKKKKAQSKLSAKRSPGRVGLWGL
ncbi:MAG: FAD-dependent oxidoreductase [Paracoccaceae bacterium]